MEDLIVRAKSRRKNPALEEVVKLMEVGDIGHLGQAARVIVINQDPEVAIIQFL